MEMFSASPDAPATLSTEARLQQMRESFVAVGLKGVLFLTGPIVAILLWRVSHAPMATGWQASLAMVLVISTAFVVAFWFRERIAYRIKASVLVVIFLAGGTAALPTFGFAGGGSVAWLVTGCFMAAALFPRRVSIAAIAFATLVLGLAAYAFISGMHTTTVNLNIMLRQPAAWANVMVSVAATTGIMAMALAAHGRAVNDLLRDVERQRDQIEHLATHDNLTGLPHLRTAVDRCDVAIQHALRAGHKVALMFIDLDAFKAINDNFGHEAGDHVLKEVAIRLKASIRAADTAARIGGDEFVVLLTALENGAVAGDVATKLLQTVVEPISYHGQPLQVGASIGISIFPDHGGDAATLRKVADVAMYSVKKKGKNGFAFANAPA